MPTQLDPEFLVVWMRAELAARAELPLLESCIARALEHGLSPDEAELDAAGQLGERTGLLEALERASGNLWLTEVREARGAAERLQRSGPGCVAWLRASEGAPGRLAQLAAALEAEPSRTSAELPHPQGGTPGCSTR